jgi:DNA polymerase
LAFQDEAGQLFDSMLNKMGLNLKKDVFATYLQKCRNISGSNDNCDDGRFNNEYAEVCKSILDRQIDIVEPKALLIFGQSAANFLLEGGGDIEQLRASGHSYKGKTVIVTYGLSLMLTETQYRFGAWEDMKKIMSVIN